MRTAIIIARKHGSDRPAVISGPEVPVLEQLAKFKTLRSVESHAEFQQVEIWTSDQGRTGFRKNIQRPEKEVTEKKK